MLLCRLLFQPNSNRKIDDLRDAKLWDYGYRTRSWSQLSAGALKTTTVLSNLRYDRKMKMERKKTNTRASALTSRRPLSAFFTPGKYMASNLNNVVPDVNEPQAVQVAHNLLFDVK